MALRSLAVLLALAGEWVCPMDPDIRSSAPARCTRCGMALVRGRPAYSEYPVRLTEGPGWLRLDVRHPQTGQRVRDLQLIHEKLLHLFVVRDGLDWFAHEHPELQPDGTFLLKLAFPGGGHYRLLCDFYPADGNPQLVPKTILRRGPPGTTSALESPNLKATLRTEPAVPLAGQKTLLFFDLDPAQGLEPYLGALGHMLVASPDLIDLMHAHPAFPEVGRTVQFNVIFPRPGLHRLWVQFQRDGKVNTLVFNVPVSAL